MPQPKRPLKSLLSQVSKKYSFITVEGSDLFCTTCGVNIKYDREHLAFRVQSHIGSKNHQKQGKEIEENGGQRYQRLTQTIELSLSKARVQQEFNRELAKALVSANIPIHKLENPHFAAFLQKWSRQSLPSGNSLRYKHIEDLHTDTLNEIRATIGENDICMMIDETTDRCERSQVNIIVSALNGSRSKPMLLDVDFVETCNAAAIFKVFIKSCNLLWNSSAPPFEKVKLLISDQAKYMIAAGRSIKTLCPDLLHVTCIAHCLNRVSECVREQHPLLDKFLAKFKEVLRGSGKRKRKYKEITGLTLPPKPVITRWTTWIQAAEYAGKHFESIKTFINCLNSKSKTVKSLKSLIEKERLRDELVSVTDFIFLIETTNKLQTGCMRLSDAAIISKEVGVVLDEATIREPAQKFEDSLKKNPDLEQLLTENELAFRLKMKFAPIVSADVERSFSITKKVLAEDRCSFKEENLRLYYVILYNSKQNI